MAVVTKIPDLGVTNLMTALLSDRISGLSCGHKLRATCIIRRVKKAVWGNVNVLREYETQITESNCSIYFVLISPIWSTVSSSVYHTSGEQKTGTCWNK